MKAVQTPDVKMNIMESKLVGLGSHAAGLIEGFGVRAKRNKIGRVNWTYDGKAIPRKKLLVLLQEHHAANNPAPVEISDTSRALVAASFEAATPDRVEFKLCGTQADLTRAECDQLKATATNPGNRRFTLPQVKALLKTAYPQWDITSAGGSVFMARTFGATPCLMVTALPPPAYEFQALIQEDHTVVLFAGNTRITFKPNNGIVIREHAAVIARALNLSAASVTVETMK